MTLQTLWKNYQIPLQVVIIILLAMLASMYIVRERLQEFEFAIRVQISDQQAILATIAETTARNGADSVTESIVRDCPIDDRARFDSLLGRLDAGLPRTQLVELEQLFGSCGNFYAERKAVMVSRLVREIEIYETYLDQLSTITGVDQSEQFKLGHWHQLATLEQDQRSYFAALVQAQKRIIDALLEGKVATSDEIVTILNEVQEAREGLLLAKQKNDILRSELTAL